MSGALLLARERFAKQWQLLRMSPSPPRALFFSRTVGERKAPRPSNPLQPLPRPRPRHCPPAPLI